jgi:hypothetical protein
VCGNREFLPVSGAGEDKKRSSGNIFKSFYFNGLAFFKQVFVEFAAPIAYNTLVMNVMASAMGGLKREFKGRIR